MDVKSCPGVGAFVSGIDLAHIDDTLLADLRGAHAQHGVLFFRNQSLTPEEHLEFARRWGVVNVNQVCTT